MNVPKSKRSLIRNTLFLFFGNGTGAVLSFGLIIILGRALGANGLGVYSTALAWIFPLTLFAEFGLNSAMLRDLTQDLTQTRFYVRHMVVMRLLMGVPCILAVGIVAVLTTDNSPLQTCLLIFAPLVLILPLFGTYSTVFRAYEQMALVGLLNLGMLLAQFMWAYLAFTQRQNLVYFAILNTLTSAGQLVVAGGIYYAYFARSQTVSLTPFNKVALLKRAFPFAIGGVLAVIQSRMGIILVERMVSPTEAGYFVVALRFMDVVRLLPMAHYDAIFPRLSSFQRQPNAIVNIIQSSSLWLVLYGVIATAIMLVSAPRLVATMFEGDYQQTALILSILAFGITPIVIKGLFNTWLYATGYENRANQMALLQISVLALSVLILGDNRLLFTQHLAMTIVITDTSISIFLAIIFIRHTLAKKAQPPPN